MNALAFVHANTQAGGTVETTGKRIVAKAQVAGVVIGLAGGVVAGISGGLLTAASWMSANEGARHWLSTTGSVLLFLVVPLIILGACCMDWMEKDKPQHQSKAARQDDEDDES